jgi:hypothetical protein
MKRQGNEARIEEKQWQIRKKLSKSKGPVHDRKNYTMEKKR